MHVYDEMKSYVGFTEADAVALTEFAVHADPHVPRIIDHFYERILAFPDAAAVLADDAQVERLKGTLRAWLRELLAGPHDHAYYARRERIGKVHVKVGLPSRFMFTAMSVIRDDLCHIAWEDFERDEARRVCGALMRATELDLAIMTGTYISSREDRQLAALQELLVAHLPVTVLLIDEQGIIVAATRPMHRVVGGTHDVVGQHYTTALPHELMSGADLAVQVRRAMDTGREIEIVRVDVEHAAGDLRHYSVTIVPLHNERARALIHLEDLTDTVEAEALLRRSETLAQLGALSAAVAHELRNPLAGMSGALQVLRRSFEDSDRRGPIVDKINEQINRLNAHITELLEFARSPVLTAKEISLEDVATAVSELVGSQFDDISVEVHGRGRAWADSHAVHQILLNLCLNAAQALEGRGAVRMVLADGLARVEDDGPGVASDVAGRIFQPFFTTKTRGTGLGLATARKNAVEMGGHLELGHSELGGAAFVLSLPVR